MMKLPLAAGLLLALLAPGFAQSSGAGQEPFLAEAPNTLRLSKIRGLGVIGLDHTRIGDIEDVLMDREGRAQAVVIGVGGFLGIGQKAVAVPFSEVRWNTGDVSRGTGPTGGTPPGTAGQQSELPQGGAERMPGAAVSNQVLSATAENRSAEVNPATGPVIEGGTAERRATVLLVPSGGDLVHAQIRFTKGDLERAPAFRMK